MLIGAPQGVPEAEVDASVLGSSAHGCQPKAKGFAREDGVVEVREGVFHITEAGRQELVAKRVQI
jgi:hypothetical protein